MATRKKTTAEVQGEDAVAPATGAAAGLATGAAIGAAVGGPVGAAVGAAVGGPIGAALGEAVNYSDAEPVFRQHWESGPYKAITKWDDVSPAYRYGFEAADRDDWRGKPYDDVSTHLRKGWTGKTKYDDVEPMIRTAWDSRLGADRPASASMTGAATVGGETVIPVVEEELQVGKRKVEKGGVKVRSHVTETPVEEQVHLHEEHVKVERRPAHRAASAKDVAFKEGTIEMTETAEEAVVAKRARVVEEVVIRKEGRDHTETVRDTVRKTDVEVEKTGGKTKVGPVEWEHFTTDFQKDWKKRHGDAGYTFEEFTPAYRFGYNLANDDRYRGDWSEVEPEARRYWEHTNKGTWDEFKDSIHHAWEKVRGKR